MFGFQQQEARKLGSQGRYYKRIEKFKASGKSWPRTRHQFWWVFHNCVAHTLLGLFPCQWTFRLHDWTSVRLNAGTDSNGEA